MSELGLTENFIKPRLHVQLTDRNSIDQVQVDRPQFKQAAAINALMRKDTARLPPDYRTILSNEEITKAWEIARSEDHPDKYAIQQRAFELMDQSVRRLKARKKKKAAVSKANQKVKKLPKRKVETEMAKSLPPKGKTKRLPKKPAQLSSKGSGIIRFDEEVEDDTDSELTPVTLSCNGMVVTTEVVRYLEDPQSIVLVLPESVGQKDMLGLPSKFRQEVGTLEIGGDDVEVNRLVLAVPVVRYRDNGHTYIVFVCVADGE